MTNNVLAFTAFRGRKLPLGSLLVASGLLFQPVARANVFYVRVTPLQSTLTPSQSVTMTASVAVTGSSPAGVTWSMSPSIGTLTMVGGIARYTAPAIIANSQTVTVTATSMGDPTKKISALLTLLPLVVSVAVTPPAFAVDAGFSQKVDATVVGSSPSVTWSMQPAIGTLSSNGVYTAPDSVTADQDVTITATSTIDPTKFANARASILAGVTFNMGTSGLSSLTYRGQNLLLAGKGSPTLSHLAMVDANGRAVNGPTSPISSVTDPAARTVKNTYTWGVVTTAYRAFANRLQLTITIQNTTPDKTINHFWLFPLALQFPANPTNLTANNNNMAFNIDTPSSILYSFGTGKVALVNDDVVQPLATGFWAAESPAATKWYVSLATDTGRSISQSWPTVPRPIAPLTTDTYTVSLRFGNPNATEAQLAGDIFALYGRTFPQQVSLANRPIASLHPTGKARPTFPTNPRGWFNDPTVDVTTSAGIAAFQSRLLKWADTAVLEMKRVGAQGGILWDMEGQQFDAAYIGDPTQLETLAPELVGVLDTFMARFTGAGLKLGLTLRSQMFLQQTGFVNVAGTNVTWAGGAQFSPTWAAGQPDRGTVIIGGYNYQVQSVESPTSLTLAKDAGVGTALPYWYAAHANTSDPGAVMKDKIQYAKNRWGASIFYVDTNVSWDGTLNAAAYFQDIVNTFPDVTVIPEAENTRHYAYTMPYNDSVYAAFGPPAQVLQVYPKAATVIRVTDQTAVTYAQQLTDAAKAGSILMFDGWYRHSANDFVAQVYQQIP